MTNCEDSLLEEHFHCHSTLSRTLSLLPDDQLIGCEGFHFHSNFIRELSLLPDVNTFTFIILLQEYFHFYLMTNRYDVYTFTFIPFFARTLSPLPDDQLIGCEHFHSTFTRALKF